MRYIIIEVTSGKWESPGIVAARNRGPQTYSYTEIDSAKNLNKIGSKFLQCLQLKN